MTTYFILAEKPSAAKAIAEGIGEAKKMAAYSKTTPSYEVDIGGDSKAYVVSAAGHLYRYLMPKTKRKWDYPAVEKDITQLRTRKQDGCANIVKEYKSLINRIKSDNEKRATQPSVVPSIIYISATDFDTEGSAIAAAILDGLDVIDLKTGKEKKPVKRMKFSDLTDKGIKDSFKNLKAYDWGMTYAGETRQIQDLLWGINVTRALTDISDMGLMTGGRVQTPALHIICDRDNDIEEFEPKKYWLLSLKAELNNGKEIILSCNDRFFKKKELDKVIEELKKLKKNGATVKLDVSKKTMTARPHAPFNGTDLQTEGASLFNISPKQIASRSKGIAQYLYSKGMISYPGTDSQKYPESWGKKKFKSLLSTIEENEFKTADGQEDAVDYVKKHRRKNPLEGSKKDPAHPCIHTTKPLKGGNDKQRKIYELIARRCLASLCEDGKDEKFTISTVVADHKFKTSEKRMKKEGWRRVYKYRASNYSDSLPDLKNKSNASVTKYRRIQKETNPPRRYSITRLIKKMDTMKVGTKNTRPNIIDKLVDRGYIKNDRGTLTGTKGGHKLHDVVVANMEIMVDTDLTRKFEDEMKTIKNSKQTVRVYKNHNKNMVKILLDMLNKFKKSKKNTERISFDPMNSVKCPECGAPMQYRKGRYGTFVGCTSYPDCENTYNLANGEQIFDKEEDERCYCGLPYVGSMYIDNKTGKKTVLVRCLGDCDRSPLRCTECGSVCRVYNNSGKITVRCMNDDCKSYNKFKINNN